jgi:uncharacterized membrane protein HdeD (DUF308 family)
MTNEPASHDIKQIWQAQTREPIGISPEELRRMAQKLPKTVLRRNLTEYVTAAFLVVIFGCYAWKFEAPLIRLGCALIVAGILYVIYHLHRRGSARSVPTDMALSTCLEFHRAELERQRDLLRSVWNWYLLPLVPGMLVFLIGLCRFVMQQPGARAHLGFIALWFSGTVAFCAGVFALVGWVNQLGARKLQSKIDALDVLRKELQ